MLAHGIGSRLPLLARALPARSHRRTLCPRAPSRDPGPRLRVSALRRRLGPRRISCGGRPALRTTLAEGRAAPQTSLLGSLAPASSPAALAAACRPLRGLTRCASRRHCCAGSARLRRARHTLALRARSYQVPGPAGACFAESGYQPDRCSARLSRSRVPGPHTVERNHGGIRHLITDRTSVAGAVNLTAHGRAPPRARCAFMARDPCHAQRMNRRGLPLCGPVHYTASFVHFKCHFGATILRSCK